MATLTQADLTAQLWEIVKTQKDLLHVQADTISSQKGTLETRQATISHLKAANPRQEADAARAEEREKYHLEALRDMAAIRDSQEDQLTAKIEEVENLSAELQATTAQLQSLTERLAAQGREIRSLEHANATLQTHKEARDKYHMFVRGLRAEAAYRRRQQTKPKVQPEEAHRPAPNPTDEQLYRKLLEVGENDWAAKLRASARHLDQVAVVSHAWIYQDDSVEDQSCPEDDLMKEFVRRATAAGIHVSHGRRRMA